MVRSRLDGLYRAWVNGSFSGWLATQPDGIKWISSWNGVPLKLKGKPGVQEYFSQLLSSFDISAYKVKGRPTQQAKCARSWDCT